MAAKSNSGVLYDKSNLERRLGVILSWSLKNEIVKAEPETIDIKTQIDKVIEEANELLYHRMSKLHNKKKFNEGEFLDDIGDVFISAFNLYMLVTTHNPNKGVPKEFIDMVNLAIKHDINLIDGRLPDAEMEIFRLIDKLHKLKDSIRYMRQLKAESLNDIFYRLENIRKLVVVSGYTRITLRQAIFYSWNMIKNRSYKVFQRDF